MQQVLFHFPFTDVPLYGFGAMLFLCFLLTAIVWGPFRTRPVGLSRDRLQDLAIIIFLAGIAGARLVYMAQYYKDFPDKTLFGLAKAFFEIWNGGIVIYGGMAGAALGYTVFYYLVLKKHGIQTWKLADAIAPLIALGLAVGRIGCYLNGCCWGQVACPECQTVPLVAEWGQFPLLPAHARGQVVRPATPDDRMPSIHGLQTSTGFTTAGFSGTAARLFQLDAVPDPRVVVAVERGSAAEAAGLKAGDRIAAVNGEKNAIVVVLRGEPDLVAKAVEALKGKGDRVTFESMEELKGLAGAYRAALLLADGLSISDSLFEQVREWPRGKKLLELEVVRGKESISLSFTPRTVTFFPTQLYETVSMVLLIFVLLSFQPFRRHDGQVMVVLMIGYACHRFLNEAIRIEPTYALGLTLSQWISVGIVFAAAALEVYLRATQPKLPAGMQPLGAPVPAV